MRWPRLSCGIQRHKKTKIKGKKMYYDDHKNRQSDQLDAVFFAMVPGAHVTREMVHEPGGRVEDTFTMTPCGACLARLLVP